MTDNNIRDENFLFDELLNWETSNIQSKGVVSAYSAKKASCIIVHTPLLCMARVCDFLLKSY